MKAKLTQAEFDSLTDATAKAAYEKVGEVYYFTGDVPDVASLQSALDKERTRASNAETAMAPFKNVDPAKYASLLELEKTANTDKLKDPAGVEARFTQMQTDFEKKLTAERERADNLTIERTLESALIAAGVHKDALADAMDAARKRVKPIGNDPARLGVLAEDGATMTATALNDWLANDFKTTKSFYFLDNGIGGTGASPINRSTPGTATIKVDREASKTNPALYQQAKEQAAKTGATIDLGHTT
jgi:hypothetical protein